MVWTIDTTPNNKLKIGSNGRVTTTSGTDSPLVFVRTRLATELGEWLYDNTHGLDYYGEDGIFRGDLPSDKVSALVRREVLDCAGVTRINSFNQVIDRARRSQPIAMNIQVVGDSGETALTDTTFTGS